MKTSITLLLISALLLTGCNNFIHDLIPKEVDDPVKPGGNPSPYYPPLGPYYPSPPLNSFTVSFNKNNTAPDSTEASPNTQGGITAGSTVTTLPTSPDRTGHFFDSWNTAADGSGTAFTASTPVTANITVYAQWIPYFAFTVRTTTPGEDFEIPTGGYLDGVSGQSYTWNIDWGDGQSGTPPSGVSSDTSPGIQHTYASPGDHQITITPAGSTDAWLVAFGFAGLPGYGANVQSNKDKMISVDSPLTLLMTRTQAQIDAGMAPTRDEWSGMFWGCQNSDFTMGPDFKFAAEWDTITTVGDYFAGAMFQECNGAAFTMGADFNLPPNITTVGGYFATQMFQECKGAAFTMNTVFNMPPNITTVGEFFAIWMFLDCSGAAFTMNTVFNMPPNITTVAAEFAEAMFQGCSGAAFTMNTVFNMPPNIATEGLGFAALMFQDCSGAAFTMNTVFNLPPLINTVSTYFAANMFNNCSGSGFQVNSVFKFPALSQAELNRVGVFQKTFALGSGAALQTRYAASIINNTFNPGSDRDTFGPAGAWADYSTIDPNWRQ